MKTSEPFGFERAVECGLPKRPADRLERMCTFAPGKYERLEVVPPAEWPSWATGRVFKGCYKYPDPYGVETSDWFGIGPDGGWWLGGTNIPAVYGWDVESLARR